MMNFCFHIIKQTTTLDESHAIQSTRLDSTLKIAKSIVFLSSVEICFEMDEVVCSKADKRLFSLHIF